MNFDKTKTKIFGDKDITQRIVVEGVQLENVERFTYLGSNVTYYLHCKSEIKMIDAILSIWINVDKLRSTSE